MGQSCGGHVLYLLIPKLHNAMEARENASVSKQKVTK